MNRRREVLEGKRIKQTWRAVKLGKPCRTVNADVQSGQTTALDEVCETANILGVGNKVFRISGKQNT